MAGSASGEFDNGDYHDEIMVPFNISVSEEANRLPPFVQHPARAQSSAETDQLLPVRPASSEILRVGTQLPEGEGLSSSWTRMAAFRNFVNSAPLPTVAENPVNQAGVHEQAYSGPRVMNREPEGTMRQVATGSANDHTFVERGSPESMHAATFPVGAGVSQGVTSSPSCENH